MPHEIWISKILNFDFLENLREVKEFLKWNKKTFFLVSQALSFRLKNKLVKVEWTQPSKVLYNACQCQIGKFTSMEQQRI